MASKKKASKKAANKGGRPRVELDMKTLTALVRIQCTAEECASVLGVSEDTIDRRLKETGFEGFAEFREKNLAHGRASLRRAQWAKAIDEKDKTMQIWLGKQMLGQRDRHEHAGDPDRPMVTKVVHEVVD